MEPIGKAASIPAGRFRVWPEAGAPAAINSREREAGFIVGV
jgi:hypothetical protein